MTKDEIIDAIQINGKEQDTDIVFQYEDLKAATDKAVLAVVDGEDMWIPYSHITEHWPDSDELQVTQWMAQQKGLD
jgi:hypothetical protein